MSFSTSTEEKERQAERSTKSVRIRGFYPHATNLGGGLAMERSPGVAEERRRLVAEWVSLALARPRRADVPGLEEFLVARGIPASHLASLNGKLKNEELEERYVQYVLARVFRKGAICGSAVAEWDLTVALGYPRKEAPTVDEVRAVLVARVRGWLGQ